MKQLDKFREPIAVFPERLTASEQDVFALALCEISKSVAYNQIAKKNGSDQKEIPYIFEFSEKILIDLFQCSKDNLRKTLEPAARSLLNANVGYSNKHEFDYFSPLVRVRYVVGDKFIIEMAKSISELIAENIQSGFSEMDLKLFVSLSGRYHRRILKILSQWKTVPNKTIRFTIDEFRNAIGVPDDKYKRFQHLKSICMEEPFKDIINKSNGVWTATDKNGAGFELDKVGRSYKYITFKMKYNAVKSEKISINSNVDNIKIIFDLINIFSVNKKIYKSLSETAISRDMLSYFISNASINNEYIKVLPVAAELLNLPD
ncbi:replication initiation protein [Photobacterium toruni]|uniref:replication initiation protein n=1 Tax=Photobacterium toruni TaxID=1935446 RepID=UPI0021100CC0|nr:replication initiation protein [Photobacterium toruni]